MERLQKLIARTGLCSRRVTVQKFFHFLNTHGISATIRKEPGSDVNAACGQLRAKFNGGD